MRSSGRLAKRLAERRPGPSEPRASGFRLVTWDADGVRGRPWAAEAAERVAVRLIPFLLAIVVSGALYGPVARLFGGAVRQLLALQ